MLCLDGNQKVALSKKHENDSFLSAVIRNKSKPQESKKMYCLYGNRNVIGNQEFAQFPKHLFVPDDFFVNFCANCWFHQNRNM